MKHRWMIVLSATALVGLALTSSAYAIFGFGDIVFDPSVFAQAVQQVVQLEQQYIQLVQTYQMVRNQYEHLTRMARQVPVDMGTRYRAIRTPWQETSAQDAYGTSGGWINGINTGADVAAGYGQAVEALNTYGAALANIPAEQLHHVKTGYATVELTDGANLAAIETIGRLRANAPAVENAIQGLEDDSLSGDPDMNTEIAVLNKINAANLIAIRGNQDTNKLLASVAEEQIIEAKRKRDAEAQAINNHIRFMAEGKAVMAAQAAGASDAMPAWRMP